MPKHDISIKGHGLLVSMLLAIGFVAGCASPPPGSPEAVYQEQQRKKEARIEAVDRTVSELPNWYIDTPKGGPNSVFAAGTATSPDLQLAMDKSTMNAKLTLADRINSRLSSKLKQFITESGQGENTDVLTEAERVTSNLVTEVNVSGYSREDAKVMAQGNRYRVYILLKYPLGEANRLLINRVKKNRLLESKLRASKAFKELEDEINRARKSKK